MQFDTIVHFKEICVHPLGKQELVIEFLQNVSSWTT